MKQVYKKKPEYLEVVLVQDDTQSIKDVFEIAEISSAPINFNENGVRVIDVSDELKVPVGNVVFKEKKSGKLVTIPQDKLLQVYDVYDSGEDEPEKGE